MALLKRFTEHQLMVPRPGTLPRGVWSPDTNAKRQIPADDDTVSKAIAALPPAHIFRRDLLAYCTLRNLIPHPQLLPLHPDEEERQGAASSEVSASSNIYDVSEVEQISIKHWQLDDGNCRALCFALPFSTKVRSVCLFNVGLNKEQLTLLCSTIPKTHVTALQLEWNHFAPASTTTLSVSESPVPSVKSPQPSGGVSWPPSASQTTSRPPSAGATSKQHPAVPQVVDRAHQETELSEDQKHELSMKQELEAGGEDDTSEVFAQLLNEGSALIFLSLRSNGITSRGAVALARAVRHSKTLEALNLFQNSIGDAGARAFAHALPFNSTLKTLSIANNKISGRGAKLLVDGLTKYAAPPELLAELDAAESQIHAQMDQAKKAKKKIDRATVIAQLGLPVLETVDGVQFAPGNATLEELLLSGNSLIGPSDVETLTEALDLFQTKLEAHLRCIKLQRLPKMHQSKGQDSLQHSQHVSQFIKFLQKLRSNISAVLITTFLAFAGVSLDTATGSSDPRTSLADAPSMKLHATLKRKSTLIHGQSEFDVFANPIVSADGSSVLYDGYATFEEDDSTFTYSYVDGAGYLSSNDGNRENVQCIQSSTLPFNSILPALNDATPIPSASIGDEAIECPSGNLFKTTFAGAHFAICASDKSGFTAYSSDMTIDVEYLENSVSISKPTLSCDVVATTTSLTPTALALLTGSKISTSNTRVLKVAEHMVMDSSSCTCRSTPRPCVFFHGIGNRHEMEELQDMPKNTSGRMGNMNDHAPCCTTVKYAVLNTMDYAILSNTSFVVVL